MAGKNTSVFGIYPTHEQLEQGIDALRLADFRATDISVLYPEHVGTKDLAHEKAAVSAAAFRPHAPEDVPSRHDRRLLPVGG